MKQIMTCTDIDNLLYLTEDELNPQEKELLESHLSTCPACRATRDRFLSTRARVLRFKTETPLNPDFSASAGLMASAGAGNAGKRIMSVIRYASGIAAVFLLFLFISEQTLSVRKISELENRMQASISSSETGMIDRITLARATLTGKQWNDLAISLHISNSISNTHDLLRIRMLLESRYRPGKANETALLGTLRNSLNMKLHVQTFKSLIK